MRRFEERLTSMKENDRARAVMVEFEVAPELDVVEDKGWIRMISCYVEICYWPWVAVKVHPILSSFRMMSKIYGEDI